MASMGSPGDRRLNKAARDRIDELGRRYEVFATRMLVAVGIVAVFTAIGLVALGIEISRTNGLASQGTRLGLGIQESRLSLLISNCTQANTEHQAIRRTLAGFGVTDVRITAAFPITRDCTADAKRKLVTR